jgi:hypothetical protein
MGQHKNMKLYTNLLAHPPFDAKEVDYQGHPFYLLHLTYPMKFNSTGGVASGDDSIWWAAFGMSVMLH